MRGLLSLDQELREIRATRRSKDQKGGTRSNRPVDLKETERPWQSDIDQVQQTMRELLRAVAGLSGVELPGLPPGLQDNEAPPPRLDIKSLKDRFRNDLEGFSIRTTEELTKRAREQTRAALEGVQNEVGGMVDKVAAEFRENLQLPAQIEKLLEPCVEDAEARLERSISQKFEQLVAQHEKLVQEKIQGTLSSVQAQMSALEQAVQQIRELRAEAVVKSSAEQPNVAAEVEHLLAEHDRLVQGRLQEALGPVHLQMSALEQTVQQIRELKTESVAQASSGQQHVAELSGRIDQLAAELRERMHDQTQIENLLEPRVGEATARLEKSISQKVEQLVTQHEQLVQQKLQGTLSSVQEQMSALEQTVRQVRELKTESVAKASTEQPSVSEIAGRIDQLAAEFRKKSHDQAQIEGLLEPRVSEAVTRLEKSICQKVEHLVGRHEQVVQEKLQGNLSSVQSQMRALEQAVQQVRDLKAEPVAELPAEAPVLAEDNMPPKDEGNLDNGLKEFLDQSFSRIEWSLNNLREARNAQPKPAQDNAANIEWLRKAIPSGSTDMLVRVQQALDHLDQLDTKGPHRAS